MRIALVKLDFCDQSAARVAAFKQVMAENPAERKAFVEHVLERIDVVDALAGERTFAEQILIGVGNRASVGIESRIAAKQQRVTRGLVGRETGADARLQDPVARHDAPRGVIHARAIERMLHRRGQLARRIAWQLRIGIKRNNVACREKLLHVADEA